MLGYSHQDWSLHRKQFRGLTTMVAKRYSEFVQQLSDLMTEFEQASSVPIGLDGVGNLEHRADTLKNAASEYAAQIQNQAAIFQNENSEFRVQSKKAMDQSIDFGHAVEIDMKDVMREYKDILKETKKDNTDMYENYVMGRLEKVDEVSDELRSNADGTFGTLTSMFQDLNSELKSMQGEDKKMFKDVSETEKEMNKVSKQTAREGKKIFKTGFRQLDRVLQTALKMPKNFVKEWSSISMYSTDSTSLLRVLLRSC